MLNTIISKRIIQAAFIISLIPSTSLATNHIQVGQPVKVFEADSMGNVTQQKLTVHLRETGTIVLARIKPIVPIAVPVAPEKIEELKALFAKSEEWSATAKANNVNIEKEIGTYNYSKDMEIKLTFVSTKKGKMTFIQMDLKANYRTATFYLMAKPAQKIVALLERAPEAISELQNKAEAEKKKSALFN